MRFQLAGRLARPTIALIAATVASIGVQAQEAARATAGPAATSVPRGIHWKNDPESIAAHPDSVAAQRAHAEAEQAAVLLSPQASAKTLSYYGGPVVKNIKVIQVLYGSGTYQSFVQGTGSGTMAANGPGSPSQSSIARARMPSGKAALRAASCSTSFAPLSRST